ncbi:hypothetical protein NSQ59_25060 [Margalitia sp. FSL K6-0131]|uniref:hypothetical protein n=1 Tax=Margalitia sp. FSL K6-0131 TaxID=2954604 RepID=UPI0030F750E6
MKNKVKVVNKFIFETAITLLPFTITYILLANWLSGVNDFGRYYEETWNPNIRKGWIEFDTFGQGFKDYSFEVSYVFWGGLISAILLVLIGKLIHLGLLKLIESRVNIKQ